MPKPKRFRRWAAVVRGPREDASAWPAVATVGAWSVRVLPWPAYADDGRACWWTLTLAGDGRAYRLAWNGSRFAECFALSRLRRQAPELELQALEVLRMWAGSSPGTPQHGCHWSAQFR